MPGIFSVKGLCVYPSVFAHVFLFYYGPLVICFPFLSSAMHLKGQWRPLSIFA